MYLILTLGLLAFVLSLVLTPLVRDAFGRNNIVDLPDKFRKLHSHPVPRVGGIAIAISYALSFLIALQFEFTYGQEIFARAMPGLWKLCLAAGLVFFCGLLDDLIGLRPWQKLFEQTLAATMAYLAGVQIHLIPGHWADPWISFPVSVLWIIGCTNAINLIDGLDGLAAGVGFFATITVVVAALTGNNLELALVTVPLAGALLAFLRYNFNPASVFLGDSGSLLVGFLLGCYGVLWSQKSATLLGMTAPLMAMAIPLMDAALAIVRRWLRNKPIFEADRSHIHHKLLDRGWTPRQVALAMYAFCGLGAALSLLEHVLENQFQGLIVVLFCVVAWIGVQHLGYSEFSTARQLITKGTFQRMVDAQTRLGVLEHTLAAAGSAAQCWAEIEKSYPSFGFTGAVFSGSHGVSESGDTGSVGHWRIQIDLAGGGRIELYRPMRTLHSYVDVEAFVHLVYAAMAARLAEPAAATSQAIQALGTTGSS